MNSLKHIFNIQSVTNPIHATAVDFLWNNWTFKNNLATNLNRLAKEDVSEDKAIDHIENSMKPSREFSRIINIVIGLLWLTPIHPVFTPLGLSLFISSCRKISFTGVDNKFAHPGLFEENDRERAEKLVKKHYPKRFKDRPYPKAA